MATDGVKRLYKDINPEIEVEDSGFVENDNGSYYVG